MTPLPPTHPPTLYIYDTKETEKKQPTHPLPPKQQVQSLNHLFLQLMIQSRPNYTRPTSLSSSSSASLSSSSSSHPTSKPPTVSSVIRQEEEEGVLSSSTYVSPSHPPTIPPTYPPTHSFHTNKQPGPVPARLPSVGGKKKEEEEEEVPTHPPTTPRKGGRTGSLGKE